MASITRTRTQTAMEAPAPAKTQAQKPVARILGKAPTSTARKQAAMPQPRKLADGSYYVDSRTATLVAYTVRNLEHGWQCDCPAGAFYRPCWHLTAVMQAEARTEAVDWLAGDLAAITEHIADGGDADAGAGAEGDTEASDVLYYCDGTRKPYTRADIRDGTFVGKALASFSWDD